MEFKIEKQVERQGLEPKHDKRYLPMFKSQSNWYFALPVLNYSLMTIKQCKEHISDMLEIKGMSQEWKLAEF